MAKDDKRIIDMTLEGEFVAPPAPPTPPIGARIMLWAIVAMVLSVTALKFWFWMEIHRHSLLREIKRVELQVAHLGAQLREARLVPGPRGDEPGR